MNGRIFFNDSLSLNPLLLNKTLENNKECLIWLEILYNDIDKLIDISCDNVAVYNLNKKYTDEFIISCLVGKINKRIRVNVGLLYRGFYTESYVLLRSLMDDIQFLYASSFNPDLINFLLDNNFYKTDRQKYRELIKRVLNEIEKSFNKETNVVDQLRENYIMLSEKSHISKESIFHYTKFEDNNIYQIVNPIYNHFMCVQNLVLLSTFHGLAFIILVKTLKPYLNNDVSEYTEKYDQFVDWYNDHLEQARKIGACI